MRFDFHFLKIRFHRLSRFHRFSALILAIILTVYSTENYIEHKKRNQQLYDSLKYDIDEPDISTHHVYNIFFIETNPDRDYLTWKDICAIESAAFNNPSARVYVYSLAAKFNQIDLRKNYQNIKLVKLDPLAIFSGTPLMPWWRSGAIDSSSYKVAHLSDAVRLAVLYKYGGFYSDTDTITLKSFTGLINYNGFGILDEKSETLGLGNGFMVFEKARHPFLTETMKLFTASYDLNEWGYNGPELLIRTLKRYCHFTGELEGFYNTLIVQNEVEIAQTKDSCDIDLLPKDYFYPFKYFNETGLLISKSNDLLLKWSLNKTYSLHLYGLHTRSKAVELNGNSLYDYMARQNCPVTCKYLSEHGLNFQEESHLLFYFILLAFLSISITCICFNVSVLLFSR